MLANDESGLRPRDTERFSFEDDVQFPFLFPAARLLLYEANSSIRRLQQLVSTQNVFEKIQTKCKVVESNVMLLNFLIIS